jgi:hypothetical protein
MARERIRFVGCSAGCRVGNATPRTELRLASARRDSVLLLLSSNILLLGHFASNFGVRRVVADGRTTGQASVGVFMCGVLPGLLPSCLPFSFFLSAPRSLAVAFLVVVVPCRPACLERRAPPSRTVSATPQEREVCGCLLFPHFSYTNTRRDTC